MTSHVFVYKAEPIRRLTFMRCAVHGLSLSAAFCFVQLAFNSLQEYIRCANNVIGNLANLDRVSRETEDLLLDEKESIVREAIRGATCAMVSLPIAEKFLRQFDNVLSRYMILVLCGESGTGKTRYCKGLLGNPDVVFEVNCANCKEPDLRGFRPLYHKLILYDEATPQMVLAQKKLFQSPPVRVMLGQSTTNCHAYSVFVSGIGMMVCSNTWTEQLQLLSDRDKSWLEDNSMVADIGRERLWIPNDYAASTGTD